jgi:hypothetical protein
MHEPTDLGLLPAVIGPLLLQNAMNYSSRTLFFLLVAIPMLVHGQVSLDGQLILEGTPDAQRQVLGLPPSLLPDDVLSATVEQSGAHRFSISTASTPSLWLVEVPALGGAPVAGTNLIITVPEGGSGDVSLLVNSSGPYPATFQGTEPLAGDGYAPGTLLSLVFDGGTFQVMNGVQHTRRACPTDMVTAGREFCVDREEQVLSNFYEATMACMQQDKRLCSWGEWIVACNLSIGLNIANIRDNYEWTNSTANGNFNARVAGGTCTVGGTATDIGILYNYRCCKTR